MDFLLKNDSIIKFDPQKFEGAGICIIDCVISAIVQHIIIGSKWIV